MIDGGRVVMDGPKAAVLAALSGQRPATPPQAGPGAPQNLHLHPTARPLPREAFGDAVRRHWPEVGVVYATDLQKPAEAAKVATVPKVNT